MQALVVGSRSKSSYFKPFSHLGLMECTNSLERIDRGDLRDIGLFIFTGGEDVNPALYGHPEHHSTSCNYGRDVYEKKAFELAQKAGIPMGGICRGAQFLCVMAGGKLVQDVTNHCRSHKLAYWDNGHVTHSTEGVCSTHHQMQYPFEIPNDEWELVAWSPEPYSEHYVFGNEVHYAKTTSAAKFSVEPDIVYYSRIHALGIQYHPEFMDERSWGFKFAQEKIEAYIGPLLAKN